MPPVADLGGTPSSRIRPSDLLKNYFKTTVFCSPIRVIVLLHALILKGERAPRKSAHFRWRCRKFADGAENLGKQGLYCDQFVIKKANTKSRRVLSISMVEEVKITNNGTDNWYLNLSLYNQTDFSNKYVFFIQ